MALFKSKEERRIERNIEMRKGTNAIRKNIQKLNKSEKEYIQKAQKARQIGAEEQFNFIKQMLKRTASQKKMLERQLLMLDTAVQIKNQAEAHSQFVQSMKSLAKAINLAFGATDFTAGYKEFEKAMAKAESMEERMELFLDMNNDSLMQQTDSELVSDKEIERMIDAQIEKDEKVEFDNEISQELKDIEKELGQDK